jgi:hypothetical protein
MQKNTGSYKLRRAALQVLKKDFLWLGKSEPVRQLKKAGILFIFFQQNRYTHQPRKDRPDGRQENKAGTVKIFKLPFNPFLIREKPIYLRNIRQTIPFDKR